MRPVPAIDRFRRLFLTLALCLSSLPVFGQLPVDLPYSGGVFSVDPATLQVTLHRDDGQVSVLSAPAFSDSARANGLTGRSWRISHGADRFRVEAGIEQDALRLSIRADQPGLLEWPRPLEAAAIEAYALPFGEGAYVPADDRQWLDWLLRRYEPDALNGLLSMPFWSELRGDHSITWLIETPFDTRFGMIEQDSRPLPRISHEFNRLAGDAPFKVSIRVGPADPLYGARFYRQWLEARHRLVSLKQKIARQPLVARLGGAAHIYLWGAGPLKTADIKDWPAFLRFFAARRQDHRHLASRLWAAFDPPARESFEAALQEAGDWKSGVSLFRRREVTRALNTALQAALPLVPVEPLPGNHDPAANVAWGQQVRGQLLDAFGPWLASPRRWGGGLSLETVEALRKAGLSRAWLGADDWRDALWHPEAVEAAKAAGYLVAVYDSYGSAHPSNLRATWATAQMGDELAAAGYRDSRGEKLRGFNGRGVYVNSRVVEPYAQRRISAVARGARLNSYFLDVDAAGPEFRDYTPGRETSEREDAEARRRRLQFPGTELGLVTGSEGGVAFYVPSIAYSHGIATQPFAWMDPDIGKNKQSPFYRGGYWPPETPDLYFKPIPLKPAVARFVTSAQFRLPLYQLVFHDSLVSTHHWEYGSLKFSSERETTALLQLLYMVPPLYHLNDQVLARDLPFIRAYDKVFRPLHERLFTERLSDFQVFSADRLVQRTSFSDGTLITVNFARKPARSPEGRLLPPRSALVLAPDRGPQLIEIARLFLPST
ncbi:Glycosyl hydrolase [Pseudomonas asplenii]|uniref:Glycosyl hydrolase n=2 Tax=Pseudomonas asplenii TaxID=53407 RepID=A0A0N0VK57_9PSED|nr:glycoside hydrolase [Pseudomonas fuscovaginae]KPA91937.1 Glycosyl hydrolase [Pseudomonas fuscovaginae]